MYSKGDSFKLDCFGIFRVDLQTKMITAGDEGFYLLTGYTKEDVTSKAICFFDMLTSKGKEYYNDAINSHHSEKEVTCFEHWLITKDDQQLYVICLIDMSENEETHEQELKIVFIDVTQTWNIKSMYNNSQRELDTLLSNVTGGVVLYEIDDNLIKVFKASDKYYNLLGYSNLNEHSGNLNDLLYEADEPRIINAFRDCINNKKDIFIEFKLKCADGVNRWIELRANLFQYYDGKPLVYGILVDVSKSKQQESEIYRQSERFRLIAENSNEVYFDYDVKADIMRWTNAIDHISKYSDEVEGFLNENRHIDVHKDDVESFHKTFIEAIKHTMSGTLEYRTSGFNDDYTWYKMTYISVCDENDRVSNIFGRLNSIEKERSLKKRIDKDKRVIERLQTTDHVTGLLNRSAFKDKATLYIKEMVPNKTYAIVYSDINDFSYVNENFGYDAGNKMLLDLAHNIKSCPATVCSCRIYSDYFVGLYCANSKEELLEYIRERNTNFANYQSKRYPASDLKISSGLYYIDDKNQDITIAMDNANLARRNIKGANDVPCGIYSDRMRKKRLHDQAITSELKSAMDSEAIELFLQPKFSLTTRELIGAEALSRWRNPDGTLKMPYEFIGVLEKMGYIINLDFYIFEKVLKLMEKWKKAGKKLCPISVNFSRLHNSKDNFIDRLLSISNKYDVEKELIEIEITESAFAQDMNNMFKNLEKLRENGFKIDIDDFGMGYSSLSVLLNAPVDIVKVDKVFIDKICTNYMSREYIKQICILISATKKDIIFEGVETEEQAKFLSEIGYHMAQGWLFDKAISANDFEKKYIDVK